MGKIRKPAQVKLVMGLLGKDKKLFDKVEGFFIKDFGKVDYKSPVLDFTYTDYYEKEIGPSLKRIFFSFDKLIYPEKISTIKIRTNKIENRFLSEKKRCLNIDPGYINDSKFILATTKDYFHRIYLSNGIFAELTLTWKKGGFQPLDWTYPDYRTESYIEIMNTIRNNYMKQREIR